MHVIETDNLIRRFGNRLAVDALTLHASAGEILGFLGPNGAGKTTTIRMLAGIIAPTSGRAMVAGIRPDREPERLHEAIGLLPEAPGFYERLSAKRNLQYFAGFYSSIDSQTQIEKYLRLIGLWERQGDRVASFSKGMKQRLALARALLHEPKVLFLDEPTAGLDPEVASELRKLISNLSQAGRTIFLSTHNLAEAEQLCDRIAVVHTRLIALDTADNLRRRQFQRSIIVRLESVSDELLETVKQLAFVLDAERQEERITVRLEDSDRDRPELVSRIVEAGGRVLEIFEEQRSLEEVYLHLVRDEEASPS